MVVESVTSASTTTTQALPLCPLVGWNKGSTSLVTKTIALSPSFAFSLCLTCPVLFVISAIALTLTLRLLSSTGTLLLGFYTSSTVSLGGRQVGASGASSSSVSCPSTLRSCWEADMAARLRRDCSVWRSRRCL
ncbi:hypothetical protein PC129_g20190 [Phytophthora cactorum]|nr:hypothetical protein Pcac1_g5750 [Phytophthora cactorum]KAG2884237.1 hypothetical protein PC114_g20198 [Phytophthora cactorum]KAG2905956.1 hypothetical protein PC117_g20625 [Phytophthora cactorum]KAG2967259.1 hypothetical protein PC118_g18693 [Phytophthora cactorum]KAG2984841.1 hypothetical protein PC119_g20281 [Phytophthora cactorum]